MFESFIGVNFWTAAFTLLNTLAIYFVAKKFLIVPVHNMITSRQKEIDDMYEDAGKARSDAAQMKADYQKKLNEAQATSDRIVKEAVERGQKREEEIISAANKEAGNILLKAESDIQLEKKKAVNEAKDEIADMAMAIAGKVVGRALTSEDRAKLVDSFIDELGEDK